MKRHLLRVGKYLISTNTNGPGKRFVIWFQGCDFRCQGCFNPEFWDKNGGKIMDVEEIINLIRLETDIEGVTYTGGEPLIQGEGLLELSKKIKFYNLTIVCYTGYRYEDLIKGKIEYVKELLNYIDILIDGLYDEKQKANLLWRGSLNQKVYFLTEKYVSYKELVEKTGYTEIGLNIGKNEVNITGIFDMEFWKKLIEKLKQL